MFRTQFDARERVHANPGSTVRILYSPKFDEKGVMSLVESGKENLYEFIQSHKESCDIHVILERFARGDVSALERVQGTYGDFSNMPRTYADMLNLVHSAEDAFSNLPVDERAKYGHSFERWLTEFGPDSEKVADTQPAKPTVDTVVDKVSDVTQP